MPRTHTGALALALGLLLLLSGVQECAAQLYTQRDASGRLVVRNIPRPAGKRSSRRSDGKAPRAITGRVSYDPLVREAGSRYGVDSELIHAVIWVESAYDPRAVSKKGAQGLMQLMPETARELGVRDSFDPRENILGGTRYLRDMLERFDHDLDLALAAYNAGPTTVESAGGVPRLTETREYVERVRERLDPGAEQRLSTQAGRSRAKRRDKPAKPLRVVVDRGGQLLVTNRSESQ